MSYFGPEPVDNFSLMTSITATLLSLLMICATSFTLPAHQTFSGWGLNMVSSLRTAAEKLDASVISSMFEENGEMMDEATTDTAFWAVVEAVNLAEEEDTPLSANVPKMLHHIFDADLNHLLNREKLTTNVTCMQPKLSGAASFGNSIGYLMDDLVHQDLPLKEGRRCEGGTCCESCSRNIFPSFAEAAECNLEDFPGLASFTFNELERVATSTILQFVRLIERVRRMIAHEYGLELASILPLQAYSRKYVAGTTQMGGGGGEGDFVILHTDESTHASYHYSSVLYLNTQGEEFEGGNFVFNDPAEKLDEQVSGKEDDADDGWGYEDKPLSLAEEMAKARRVGRKLTPFHPQKGAAVIFSSGWENMHEVEKLTSGIRYAVPAFFTTCPVPEGAYKQMVVGKPQTYEDIADDWLHLLLAHRQEEPAESVGRVKELLMKWHYMCSPLEGHRQLTATVTAQVSTSSAQVAEEAASFSQNDDYSQWEAVVDPSTGKTYYYHAITRQTSWSWPPN